MKNWRESFKPITKHSNRNHVITFDSHLKTALCIIKLTSMKEPKNTKKTNERKRSTKLARPNELSDKEQQKKKVLTSYVREIHTKIIAPNSVTGQYVSPEPTILDISYLYSPVEGSLS